MNLTAVVILHFPTHTHTQIITPHTHLDLLAPMPGVEVDKPRILLLEGNLKFRDPTTARVQTVCTHAVCVSDGCSGSNTQIIVFFSLTYLISFPPASPSIPPLQMVVHVFLFTDLLLLTKPTKGKNFTIVRPVSTKTN